MAGLIKKQILKILTKFTDGLTPDDIQEKIKKYLKIIKFS